MILHNLGICFAFLDELSSFPHVVSQIQAGIALVAAECSSQCVHTSNPWTQNAYACRYMNASDRKKIRALTERCHALGLRSIYISIACARLRPAARCLCVHNITICQRKGNNDCVFVSHTLGAINALYYPAAKVKGLTFSFCFSFMTYPVHRWWIVCSCCK